MRCERTKSPADLRRRVDSCRAICQPISADRHWSAAGGISSRMGALRSMVRRPSRIVALLLLLLEQEAHTYRVPGGSASRATAVAALQPMGGP